METENNQTAYSSLKQQPVCCGYSSLRQGLHRASVPRPGDVIGVITAGLRVNQRALRPSSSCQTAAIIY